MAVNPRYVPWMTIFAVLGLVLGYGIGTRTHADPLIPAFWGLCIGTAVALVVRFVLTWRWSKRNRAAPAKQPAGNEEGSDPG
jgi:uncharacterized membrane protein YfcA